MKKLRFVAVVLLILAVLGLRLQTLPTAPPEGVLRLHVIGASDHPLDQEIKLCVRDAILKETTALLSDCQSKEEAALLLEDAIPRLKNAADAALIAKHSENRAKITLTREDYPEKTYAGLTLPRGEYTSLKVEIGQAAGKNWWCVLFPSLCLASSLPEAEDAFLDAGFSPDQVRDLSENGTGKIVFRFRFFEWLGELFS